MGRISGESGNSRNLSALIVDDEWIVARGVQKTLEVDGYAVTGVASSAHDALLSVEQRRPDLALVDIVISGPVDGINLACLLRERHGIPSIFLTAHTDQPTMQRALRASPIGYVVKPFQESQLLSSVQLATAGLTPSVSASTASHGEHNDPASHAGHANRDAPRPELELHDAGAPDTPRQDQFRRVAQVLTDWPPRSPRRQVLTRREFEVVRLLLANGRVSSIAEDLGLSPATVRNHFRRIYSTLGVHSQVELIRELTRHGTTDQTPRLVQFAARP